MAADLEKLVVSMAADFKAFENAMRKASGMTREQLKALKADAGAAGAAAEEGFQRFGRGASSSQGNVINFRNAMSNMGLQAQDVAVQLSMGTDALRVFGQQAPQILGAFGPLGIAIGAAAAALPLLAMAFNESEADARAFEAAAESLESALTSLKSAGFEVAEATDLFGAALQQVAKTTATAAIDALRQQLRDVTADVVLLQSETDLFFEPGGAAISGATAMAEKFGLTDEQAQRLHETLVELAGAPMDQMVRASQDAFNVISDIARETGGLSPLMQEVADSVQAAGQVAATMAENTSAARTAAQGLAGDWASVLANAQQAMMAAGQAMAATERLRVARQGINNSRPTSYGGALGTSASDYPISGVPANQTDYLNSQFPIIGQSLIGSPQAPAGRGRKAGGGGRSGAVDRAAAEEQREINRTIRDSVREVAEAQREVQRENEKTADTFSDIFVSAIDGSRSLSDSLKSLAQEIAKTFISNGFQALLNGGAGGGILGAIFGSNFGGARASGGPVVHGNSYLVGERGPEIFTPRQSGTIIPNGGGAGTTGVRVWVENGNIRAEIDDRVSRGMTTVRREVPGIVANAQLRGG